MAANAVREDNEIANTVLRDMHKELVLQINVDEITIHLVSTGMITSSQRETLQNDRCTASNRNVFLLSNVLGGKGYWGLKTLLAALRGDTLYQPHIELASRIENEYCERLQRPRNIVQSIPQPQSHVNQQAPDPRTGESPPSTMSSIISPQQLGSQYCLQFNHPGEYNVKVNCLPDNSGLSQSHLQHRDRKDTSESHDDSDFYSSCHSSLTSLSQPARTKLPPTTALRRPANLAETVSMAVLQKHEKLQEARDMKIILVGDSSVGKTSIILQYIFGECGTPKPTCGTGYFTQYVHHKEKNINVKLYLWDTMGQERFNSITANVYKKSDAAVIVFDLVSENTLNSVHWWLKQLHDRLPSEKRNIPVVLAGNKSDLLPSEHANIKRKARQKAFDLEMKDFILVSAVTGFGMDELFGRVVTLALDNATSEESENVIHVTGTVDANKKSCSC